MMQADLANFDAYLEAVFDASLAFGNTVRDRAQRNAGLTYTIEEEAEKDSFAEVANTASLGGLAEALEAELPKLQQAVFYQAGSSAEKQLARTSTERPTNQDHLKKFLFDTAVAIASPILDAPPGFEVNGMFFLDDRYVTFLRAYGDSGRNIAAEVQKAATERLRDVAAGRKPYSALSDPWLHRPNATGSPSRLPLRIDLLARVLWRERVGPALARAERNAPGTVRAVAYGVVDLLSGNWSVVREDEKQKYLLNHNQGFIEVPSIHDSMIEKAVEDGLKEKDSEYWIDIIEWQVVTAHAQYALGAPNYFDINALGGWGWIAFDQLKYHDRSALKKVRSVIQAQGHLVFSLNGWSGNMLTYAEEQKAAPGRQARVLLRLGPLLLFGFATDMKSRMGNTLSDRAARRFVPILGKAELIGRRNDYAAQRRMVWRLAIELRDRAEELATRGSVRLTNEDWTRIAAQTNAPRSGGWLLRVIDAWVAGGDEAEPLIVRSGEEFKLHDSRKAAHESLVRSGIQSARSRQGGIKKPR